MRKQIKVDRHPDPVIDAAIDSLAHDAVQKMTPRDIGLMLYPNAIPISLSQMPADVVADHRNRYTQEDLEAGQFLEVLPGKFTFITSHITKRRKSREKESEQPTERDT